MRCSPSTIVVVSLSLCFAVVVPVVLTLFVG
jgi:hypothetical protein